jgi:hypothetical protein
MNLLSHELLNMTYIHSTTDANGVIVERTCRFPPIFTRNIELLQQWIREVAGTYDIRIWFNLNESAFTIWKQLNFQGEPTTPDDG